jgi:replicative DNA helicase
MQAPTDQTLTDARGEMERLLTHATGHEVNTLGPVLSTVYDELKQRAENPCDIWGIPVGLPNLDKETGGQQPGELTLLAGEPGLGKTWFAIGSALEMAKSAAGAFFSLEMGKEAITRRILAATSCTRSRNLRTGRVDENDWIRIGKAMQELEAMPFYLDDRSRDTGGLRAALARMKRDANIRWFVLDYMMLLEDYGSNETEKTSNISRALKHICRDLDLAGFVIHSVTKAGMDKAGSEANAKSNLRGSGQVIYDADLVLYLTEFEPDSARVFYSEDEKKRLATLWVKKGRELEDPRIRVHLTRRQNSPLWGELMGDKK